MVVALELGQLQKVYSNMRHFTPHDNTHPNNQTAVISWLLACSAGLLFWVVAGTFLVALVW